MTNGRGNTVSVKGSLTTTYSDRCNRTIDRGGQAVTYDVTNTYRK